MFKTTTLVIVVLLLILGWAASYFALQRKLKRTIEALRREMDERLKTLSSSIELTRPSAVVKPAPASPKPAPAPALSPAAQSPKPVPAPAEAHPEITPEILLVITAAVTAFLGKKVRIRSAQMLQTPYELFNPWSQQGRVFVQASHNLPQRGHWE